MGRGSPHTPSAPAAPLSLCLWHSPHSKILDPPLVLATMLAAALTSAPSLGRQLEASLATVTSAAGSQPSGPWSPWSPVRQTPKSMASPVIELAEMEGGRAQ